MHLWHATNDENEARRRGHEVAKNFLASSPHKSSRLYFRRRINYVTWIHCAGSDPVQKRCG